MLRACSSCGTRWCAERLRCPACGAAAGDATLVPLGQGTVESSTTVTSADGQSLLAAVRVDELLLLAHAVEPLEFGEVVDLRPRPGGGLAAARPEPPA